MGVVVVGVVVVVFECQVDTIYFDIKIACDHVWGPSQNYCIWVFWWLICKLAYTMNWFRSYLILLEFMDLFRHRLE
jgi:hypothetical protein